MTSEPDSQTSRDGYLVTTFISSCPRTASMSLVRWSGLKERAPLFSRLRPSWSRGFQFCIDDLSSWLMRTVREIGHGAALQALREREAGQERADARSAAL